MNTRTGRMNAGPVLEYACQVLEGYLAQKLILLLLFVRMHFDLVTCASVQKYSLTLKEVKRSRVPLWDPKRWRRRLVPPVLSPRIAHMPKPPD